MTNKTLFQLSYPLLLNAFIGMAVTLVDTIIVSSYSENAAAAVSIANQILLVVFDLSALFATGAVILVSQSLGKGEEAEARTVAKTAMMANAAISLVAGAVILLTAQNLISAIHCPAEILADATLYLQVGAFTIVFNGVMMAGTATLRGFGETKIILILGLFAYGSYLLAEYVFIFGWGPIPELGVLGSALATLLIRSGAVVALLVVSAYRLKIRFRLRPIDISGTSRRIRHLYSLSWPTAFDNLAYGIYQMLLVSYIARYNVVMLLSRTFTLSLSAFLTVVLMSISQANEVMVGYRYGAGNSSEMKQCVIRASAISVLLTTTCASLLYWNASSLVGLFTQQPEIHKIIKQLLWITIFVQPFSAVNTILFHSLKAIGDVVIPVVATQIMMWSISVPLAYWLTTYQGLGVVGLWYVLILEEALKAIFLLCRWQYQVRSFGHLKSPQTLN